MEALNTAIAEKQQYNFQKLNNNSTGKNFKPLRIVNKEKVDKKDVVRTISHEIRTPLNVINLALEIVEDNNSKSELTDISNLIKDAGQKLIKTVENIMEISILESCSVSLEKQEYHVIEDIIKPILYTYENAAAEKNNRLQLFIKTNDCIELVDKYFVEKAIHSLLDNAIKFTENGIICVHLFRDENSALICEISDTGIGISDDFKDRLFTPFSQESDGITREYLGLGLDLYLAKLALRCTNADIKVHSLKDYGTKFTITFE